MRAFVCAMLWRSAWPRSQHRRRPTALGAVLENRASHLRRRRREACKRARPAHRPDCDRRVHPLRRP